MFILKDCGEGFDYFTGAQNLQKAGAKGGT